MKTLVSPTSFGRALAMDGTPPGTRLGLDDPEPEWLAPLAGPVYPVYGQLYVIDGWRDKTQQQPEIEFAFYSRRFTETERVARAFEAYLMRYPVRVQVGEKLAVLDRAEVVTATREVPWDVDTSVTRFIGSYQLRTRS